MNKFNVDGKYSERKEKRGAQLPACEPEILPPVAREEWKPRSAEPINVPSPVMRRGFFGQHDHAGFQQQVREVEQSERAVTSLIRTRTEKEQAVVEYERALARRELMPDLIEQDRLAVFADVSLARAALRRTVEHINQQHDAHAYAASEERRLRELEALEYETERARKRRVLAEEQAMAAGAEEIAAVKAKAAAYEAEAELEKARRKVNLAKERRIDIEVDEVDKVDDREPAAFREELARGRERENIRKAARRREEELLAEVDGDETKLSQAQRDRREEIRGAAHRSLKNIDLGAATGTIFPDADEEEPQ